MSTLVIYYSYGGNTSRVAQRIARDLDADLAEVKTKEPYVGSYNDVVDQGQREVRSGYLPKVEPLGVDLDGYDTVVLGTPVWWYTCAPAMASFLSGADLSGKRVYPFATNGGWLGHTFEDIQAACKGAKVMGGLNVRFNEDEQRTSESDVARWVAGIK